MSSSLSIVYVLTNSAMPGLVKIGYTAQDDANSRIAQLYTTGVPVPFTIEYACIHCGSCRSITHRNFTVLPCSR